MNDYAEPVTAIVPAAAVQLGTLTADTPKALVSGATTIANTLAQLIRKQNLSVGIEGREYVKVEGWTVLAALLGVIAREESVIEREDGSYLATVQLVRMKDDVIVSRASAECGMDEPRWVSRYNKRSGQQEPVPKFQRRSMALTRATGKASRLAFSWIMTMAGFEPTPAEEMPPDPIATRDGIATREGTPTAPEFVPSGKYQGKKWEELSGDYLAAIVKGDKAGPTFKALCQKEIDRRAVVFTSGTSTDDDIPF